MMNVLIWMGRPITTNGHDASTLAVEVAWGCLGVFVTAARLVDAGLSRWWACLILPTVASPWLFPLLIPGAEFHGSVRLLVDALRTRNPSLVGLAVAVLAFPFALCFAPTRVLRENSVTDHRSTETASVSSFQHATPQWGVIYTESELEAMTLRHRQGKG
jgi:hypothetical protein